MEKLRIEEVEKLRIREVEKWGSGEVEKAEDQKRARFDTREAAVARRTQRGPARLWAGVSEPGQSGRGPRISRTRSLQTEEHGARTVGKHRVRTRYAVPPLPTGVVVQRAKVGGASDSDQVLATVVAVKGRGELQT